MNLSIWLINAFLTGIFWGMWGFLGKVAARTLGWQNLLLLSSLGYISIFPIFFYLYHKFLHFSINNIDYYWAILSGMFASAGTLFFYFALTKGEASRVVGISAAYPLIVAGLAFIFLREPITLIKVAGLLFTMVGVYILSV